ncbi:RHS repeat domain-containing protein [Chryseobacterium sp. CT-SW4]|uniref:hypothetical protein n=1 Tax=Chryseobacterium sp. SW-1 TaxID=3157343 RepID=UPI003B0192CA
MKKNILLFITLLLLIPYFSSQVMGPQPTSVSNPMDNIKKLYPAAPTVNNLMKFEEVPVSNYTGIPDIKIPITNIKSNNSGMEISISLAYHPLSAKPDDKSGEVGLGWNLLAGGSITRMVRGGPDHATILSYAGAQPTIGIYFDEYTNNFTDKNYTRKYLDALSTGTGLVPDNLEFKKLFYEGMFHNRYDTEYDLYQYNFMGYTGRFIIKKDINNSLFVEKLDKNNLEIEIESLNPNNSFEAIAFTIKDDMGNKYLFDILEVSTRSILSNKVGFKGYISTHESTFGSINSAFHLSKISNASNIELVRFNYYPPQQVFYTDYSQIYRALLGNPIEPTQVRFDSEIPAAEETNAINTTSLVRNLQDIEIINKGKVSFTYVQGREDTNFTNPQQLQKLDKISVIDQTGKVTNSYQFNYNYFQFKLLGREIYDKRLSLTKVTKYNSNSIKEFDYIFNYNENTNNFTLGKDHWDWFNCVKPEDNYLLAKDPSKECITINLLKNIKMPSGGVRAFNFESNTYSYIGSEPIDPYESPENWEKIDKEITYVKTENNTRKQFFTLTSPQSVQIVCLNNQIVNYAWSISLFKKVGDEYLPVGSIGPSVAADPTFSQYHTRDFEAGEYYAVFNVDFMANFNWTVNIIANYKDRKANNIVPYLLGGGVRINNISYYDSSLDFSPSKKTNFSYTDIAGSGKSSGSLIFPKPVHSYIYDYTNTFVYKFGIAGDIKEDFINKFKIFSSENFLPVQKTKGADVGYQHVIVSETGKGENIFTYTSPIDTPNPEQISDMLPPFIPITNYDYKRGLFIEEQRKDNTNNLLYKKNNQYINSDLQVLTGMNLRHINSPYTEYLYAGHFKTYGVYQVGCENGGIPNAYCGGNGMVTANPTKEIVGRANLDYSESKEYFGIQVLKESQNLTYNLRDYPIKQISTFADGGVVKTSYSYAHEKGNQKLIDANMVGIPLETTTTQTIGSSTKTLSRTETRYDDPSHLFPTSVKSYDLQNSATSYTEVTYDQYDSKGNLQQYTTKDGVPVAIVWGYNQTQPIAKVEGATYAQVSSLASSIITASNTDASAAANNDETTLLTALDNFRQLPALLNAQVSTYTYDPLIGVRSITPPSGIREYYIYDAANRLEKVVDINNNILKEYKYNYKQ